jgi:hypothetical protein
VTADFCIESRLRRDITEVVQAAHVSSASILCSTSLASLPESLTFPHECRKAAMDANPSQPKAELVPKTHINSYERFLRRVRDVRGTSIFPCLPPAYPTEPESWDVSRTQGSRRWGVGVRRVPGGKITPKSPATPACGRFLTSFPVLNSLKDTRP